MGRGLGWSWVKWWEEGLWGWRGAETCLGECWIGGETVLWREGWLGEEKMGIWEQIRGDGTGPLCPNYTMD